MTNTKQDNKTRKIIFIHTPGEDYAQNFENLQTEQNKRLFALAAAPGSYKMAPMPRMWVVLILVYSGALHAQNNSPPEVRSAAGNAATNQQPPTPDSTALEFINAVEPAYPLDAVKRKLQGLVMLKVVVSEAGDADSETVISGDPALAQAAVDAVKKWKFKPFIRNAKSARVSAILPLISSSLMKRLIRIQRWEPEVVLQASQMFRQ